VNQNLELNEADLTLRLVQPPWLFDQIQAPYR
jgi:hypothetical protein